MEKEGEGCREGEKERKAAEKVEQEGEGCREGEGGEGCKEWKEGEGFREGEGRDGCSGGGRT